MNNMNTISSSQLNQSFDDSLYMNDIHSSMNTHSLNTHSNSAFQKTIIKKDKQGITDDKKLLNKNELNNNRKNAFKIFQKKLKLHRALKRTLME